MVEEEESDERRARDGGYICNVKCSEGLRLGGWSDVALWVTLWVPFDEYQCESPKVAIRLTLSLIVQLVRMVAFLCVLPMIVTSVEILYWSDRLSEHILRVPGTVPYISYLW